MKARKFNRETDQRRALIKSLAEALIERESIETTLPRAKEVARFTEKLITKAKKADLHSRRQVIAGLHTITNAHKLVDSIAPQLNKRSSGYFKIRRTRLRRGDRAQLALISFVDDIKVTKRAVKAKPKVKPVTKKTASKKIAKQLKARPKADRGFLGPKDEKARKQLGGQKPGIRHTRSGER